jgi:hypothetical protein
MSVKVLCAGAVAALVSGMLLGGAMRPNLGAADGRPAGPQMFASWSWSRTRSTGPFDPGAAIATVAPAPADKKAPSEVAVIVARTDREDLPPPPHDYPSSDGGRVSAPNEATTAVGD